MKLKTLEVLTITIVPLLLILCGFIFRYRRRCHQAPEYMTTLSHNLAGQILFAIALTILILIAIYPFALHHGALAHGADAPSDMSIADLRYSITHTPEQTKSLPDDLTGQIIIYYRFDCHACLDIHDELKQAINGRPVYFVATRSAIGKTLLEKYPVGSVPAGIYITQKPGVFYSESLAVIDQNQTASLNADNLERLFLFQTDGY